jgi:hypothetical protein
MAVPVRKYPGLSRLILAMSLGLTLLMLSLSLVGGVR